MNIYKLTLIFQILVSNTLDRDLKVSDTLVGYYYPRNQTTWYFDKAKYLSNDTVTDWWSYNNRVMGWFNK